MYIRSNHKDKKASSKSTKADEIEMTETASIKGLPIEPSYATVTKPSYATVTETSDVDTFVDTKLPYAYARTGPVKVR